MNEPITSPDPNEQLAPHLRPPTEKTKVLNYVTPNVLLHAKDGLVHILESRNVQLPHILRSWYTDKEEKRDMFQPRALARFNVAGHTVNVLCDNDTYRGNLYSASVPTATEYQALIGKEVRIWFECRPCHEEYAKRAGVERLWTCHETCIILPDMKDE